MNIEKLSELLPELTPEELNIISSKSLNDYFVLQHLSEEQIFIPRKGYIYIIKSGKIVSTGYIEDRLEIRMEFHEEDCLGYIDLLVDRPLDFILKGMPSATVLEVPMKKIMEKTDIQVFTGLHDLLSKAMMQNALKLIKRHAAKVNFSNEQYLIDFLISNGGEFIFTSTIDLAHLLHIEIRTFQRIIKKLIENKIIEKNGETLKIIDMDSAKELLEI